MLAMYAAARSCKTHTHKQIQGMSACLAAGAAAASAAASAAAGAAAMPQLLAPP
jgi:hypothetical protein